MAKELTHCGYIHGTDVRTPKNYKRRIELRETLRYWIEADGTKYRKDDGRVPNSQWPMYRLDIASIVSL